MKIVFIVPASDLRRIPLYRLGGKIYGQSNSITGPLILGGILKKAGYQVEAYEELNARLPLKHLLKDTDIFCLSLMTSNAPRGYELADIIHKHSNARVIMGGMHPTWLPEEALQHADQVIVGEGEKVILDVVKGRLNTRIVQGISLTNVDEAPFPDYSILKTPCVAANVISTRGCPYRCTFCTTSRMFAPYRQRSVDNVIDEIHKGQNIEDIRKAGAACEKYKIRMIASIVLGLDEDTKKDMDRSVAFAKSIHAYQLQPAILTPFPGTPVYDQFCQDHRMITSDWSRFDMMNVTFLPKHMSPWELQETFYEASKYFYDFKSVKDIRQIFGAEYAFRRFGLAIMARLGVFGAHVASKVAKGSVYYDLRHYSSKESTASASKVTDAT